MNVFFALKGSKYFDIYLLSMQLVLSRVAALKSFPALIFSADYILLLVLWDHRMYSESSELMTHLDSFSEQI